MSRFFHFFAVGTFLLRPFVVADGARGLFTAPHLDGIAALIGAFSARVRRCAQ